MPTLIKVTFEPDGRSVQIEPGMTVMTAARQLGLYLTAPCGGRGVCGNCRVEVLRAAPEPTPAEREHLRADELAAGWRLACQAKLNQDAVVAVPEATGARDQKILTAGVAREVTLNPNVRSVHLSVDPPSLQDGRSDADRFLDALRKKGTFIFSCPHLGAGRPENGAEKDECPLFLPAEVVSGLPRLLRESVDGVTAVVVGDRVAAAEAGDTTGRCYGAAVDLGTTTVVATLFDLTTGAQLALASETNPQTALGDDVVSRIHHASTAADGLADLQRRAVECIDAIIGEACRRAAVDRRHVREVTVAGNTTMNHLLLGIDPSQVAQAPYAAALRSGMWRPAAEVRLPLGAGAGLYTLPNIAGFVGGDTVGVILATDLQRTDGVRLAIDIGTNGEIVLAMRGGLVACSTAAGPAFEGARIAHGMRASSGAIDGCHFKDGDLVLSTIDNEPARGLCGTGLIEAVSTLLALGAIDPTGRLCAPDECPNLPERVAERIVDGKNGYQVILAHDEIAGVPYDVSLTQRDIREVQLAKAAIAAGIHILLGETDLTVDRIDEVLLAGAFGNHICLPCAVQIGLLPDVPLDRITFVGNAAAEGARMVLLDRDLRDEAERISRSTRYLELAAQTDFQTAFADAMFFPTETGLH